MEKACWGAPGPSRQGALHLVPRLQRGRGTPPPTPPQLAAASPTLRVALGIECAGWRRSQNQRDCVGGRGCERCKRSVGLGACPPRGGLLSVAPAWGEECVRGRLGMQACEGATVRGV